MRCQSSKPGRPNRIDDGVVVRQGSYHKLLLEHAAKPDLADHQGNTTEKPAQAQGLSRVAEIIKFHIRDLNVFATNYIFNCTITVN